MSEPDSKYLEQLKGFVKEAAKTHITTVVQASLIPAPVRIVDGIVDAGKAIIKEMPVQVQERRRWAERRSRGGARARSRQAGWRGGPKGGAGRQGRRPSGSRSATIQGGGGPFWTAYDAGGYAPSGSDTGCARTPTRTRAEAAAGTRSAETPDPGSRGRASEGGRAEAPSERSRAQTSPGASGGRSSGGEGTEASRRTDSSGSTRARASADCSRSARCRQCCRQCCTVARAARISAESPAAPSGAKSPAARAYPESSSADREHSWRRRWLTSRRERIHQGDDQGRGCRAHEGALPEPGCVSDQEHVRESEPHGCRQCRCSKWRVALRSYRVG